MTSLFSRKLRPKITRTAKAEVGYVQINGVMIWNKVWNGKGEPIVLLHGGLSSTDSWDYKLIPFLSQIVPAETKFSNPFSRLFFQRKIYAFDRSAHGKSGIADGYYHFDYQCRETIAYLTDIVKEPAHLIGWSDGAIISLLVALQRPDLVKSIVSIGGNYHWDCGLSFDPADISITEEDKVRWQENSPIPLERLTEIVHKAFEVWASEPNLTTADLAKITQPVLVTAGDDEVFTHQHTVEFYEALPNGRLAIVPGSSHSLPKEKPELLSILINDFYQNLNYPHTRHPVRRKAKTEEIYGVHDN